LELIIRAVMKKLSYATKQILCKTDFLDELAILVLKILKFFLSLCVKWK